MSVTISHQRIDSPIGPLIAAASADAIAMLEFAGKRVGQQLDALARWYPGEFAERDHPLLEQLRAELARYFRGELREFTVPLAYPGSAFQQDVWRELLAIPYGETRSYESLAQTVGRPNACRAVGTINGQNRIAIVIPCHRVVNKGGKLGGYGGGLWRKQALLELEQGRGGLSLPGS